VYLFELKPNGGRVERSHRFGNLVAYSESVLFRLPGKIHKEAVRVAIHHPGTPIRVLRYCLMGLWEVKYLCEVLSSFSTAFLSLTFSSVSRPVWTIASAISTHGIRPENDALVYPYVTLAIYFNPSCRALSIFNRV
jgi:hypothetical protein